MGQWRNTPGRNIEQYTYGSSAPGVCEIRIYRFKEEDCLKTWHLFCRQLGIHDVPMRNSENFDVEKAKFEALYVIKNLLHSYLENLD